MSSKPVVVIVPGSCHRAEHYQKLINELAKNNYEATAVTPPSLDSDPPHTSWDKDAEAVRRVIMEYIDSGRDVVGIAHSFGGVAMSEGVKGLGKRASEGSGLKGGVVGLVYMTAVALREGQSQASLIVPETPEEKELSLAYQEGMKKYAKGMMPINEAGMIVPDRETTRQIVYSGCDPKEVDAALDLLGAQPIAPMGVPVTYTAYRDIPSTFIVCKKDLAVPPYIQEKMVAQAGDAMDVVRCEEGHSPHLSNPKLVADCIRRVAGESI
ncbi:hypothetical protein AJ78_02642 [Emergomyces pasteurianus Ep9510]|uniref:AB hydrolase-1 domain-containing protein n=1 Tax=Emergomyces pasteurianus Ep9510 TaxID=1447872 RepID=A0A1J9QN23_9EURO|nr:hypothetical protein AJ78_02642 [Emergomyces pasteurianus Ep9510]